MIKDMYVCGESSVLVYQYWLQTFIVQVWKKDIILQTVQCGTL